MKSILSTLTVAPAVAPAPLFNPETSKPTEARAPYGWAFQFHGHKQVRRLSHFQTATRCASLYVSTWAISAVQHNPHIYSPLTILSQRTFMVLNAEQCWKRAACYDRISEDESAPVETRILFVRQANLLRIMGRLAALEEDNRPQNQTLRAA
jgi:transposase